MNLPDFRSPEIRVFGTDGPIPMHPVKSPPAKIPTVMIKHFFIPNLSPLIFKSSSSSSISPTLVALALLSRPPTPQPRNEALTHLPQFPPFACPHSVEKSPFATFAPFCLISPPFPSLRPLRLIPLCHLPFSICYHSTPPNSPFAPSVPLRGHSHFRVFRVFCGLIPRPFSSFEISNLKSEIPLSAPSAINPISSICYFLSAITPLPLCAFCASSWPIFFPFIPLLPQLPPFA